MRKWFRRTKNVRDAAQQPRDPRRSVRKPERARRHDAHSGRGNDREIDFRYADPFDD